MAWQIAYFYSDQTVSMISEKWPKKNGKKSYFPKTKVAKNIKKEANVDKKSDSWGLYACRILMNGAKFHTYEEARNAEAIAQDHSTMTSFEASYRQKRKSRKHPNVFHSGSDYESDDDENIARLRKQDSESVAADKEYTYVHDDRVSENNVSNASSSDENVDNESENELSESGSGNDSNGEQDDVNETENEIGERSENESEIGSHANESSVLPMFNHLESTSELCSPAGHYNFSDDRFLIRVEKLLMHVCRELEVIKDDVNGLKTKSKDTEAVVGKLVTVCKDLSVEVFSCTEEFKKRNGMFTDMLVPDLKLPVTRRKHYKKNELQLETNKKADNMMKYLASTVNESAERPFIEGCFVTIFDLKFLAEKVWWKKEAGKVLIKDSQILRCIKESFKMKFGLAEPKKTDKQIVRLIYKVCRNLKDKYRKSKKKAEENDQCFEEDAVDDDSGGDKNDLNVDYSPAILKRAKKRPLTTEAENDEDCVAVKKKKKEKSKSKKQN